MRCGEGATLGENLAGPGTNFAFSVVSNIGRWGQKPIVEATWTTEPPSSLFRSGVRREGGYDRGG
jgi:hypothetical protein